jgi:hypothetical protein
MDAGGIIGSVCFEPFPSTIRGVGVGVGVVVLVGVGVWVSVGVGVSVGVFVGVPVGGGASAVIVAWAAFSIAIWVATASGVGVGSPPQPTTKYKTRIRESKRLIVGLPLRPCRVRQCLLAHHTHLVEYITAAHRPALAGINGARRVGALVASAVDAPNHI